MHVGNDDSYQRDHSLSAVISLPTASALRYIHGTNLLIHQMEGTRDVPYSGVLGVICDAG